MKTTPSPEQELIVVERRKTLLLATDDLLAVLREFINPAVSRAGLGRCLRRHGVSDLRDLVPVLEGEKPAAKKTLKDYEPGYLHIDIKYLPQMPDETSRRYLFVAIDRATRWVFMEIYADQSDSSSTDFLIKVKNTCPVNIVKLLTDNGSQFTDRFTSKKKDPITGDRIPFGKHAFDVLCKDMAIEHRLIPPRHPQTNGMVERFMAASVSLLGRPALVRLPSSNRRCVTISRSTTAASRSVPSIIKLRSRHSKSGTLKNWN